MSGVESSARPEEDRVSGDHPGVVVNDNRQPRADRPTRLVQHHDVQLGVVGLPNNLGRAAIPRRTVRNRPNTRRVHDALTRPAPVQDLHDAADRLIGRDPPPPYRCPGPDRDLRESTHPAPVDRVALAERLLAPTQAYDLGRSVKYVTQYFATVFTIEDTQFKIFSPEAEYGFQ